MTLAAYLKLATEIEAPYWCDLKAGLLDLVYLEMIEIHRMSIRHKLTRVHIHQYSLAGSLLYIKLF